MEIRSDYLESLLRQEQSPKTVSAGREGFGELLSQEIGRAAGFAESGTPLPPGVGMGVNPLIADPAVVMDTEGRADAHAADDLLLRSLTGQTAGLLDSWDSYVAALESGGTKNAWGILSGMEQTLRSVREKLDGMQRPDAGLQAMVNELEVLNATEKFKFNRGDYL